MADAVDDSTVMVVGSAPSYPQGVIDPIPELAAMAAERGILCHVDACMGGFILPFLGQLGHLSKPWDLSVPGVTSISADLHKYGYASKGISVIVYRDRRLARMQPFVTSNWLGGLYGSPSMAGTRPAGPIAAGWAVLHHLGEDGYLRLADEAHRAATTPPGGHRRPARDWRCGATPTPPSSPSAATRSTAASTPSPWGTPWPRGAAGSSTARAPPDSLHATVQAGHLAVVDELCADLASAAAELIDQRRPGRRTGTPPTGRSERTVRPSATVLGRRCLTRRSVRIGPASI